MSDERNPLQRFFDDAVWRAAFDRYEKDCGGELWRAPNTVQEAYKAVAREEMRNYLADSGIV